MAARWAEEVSLVRNCRKACVTPSSSLPVGKTVLQLSKCKRSSPNSSRTRMRKRALTRLLSLSSKLGHPTPRKSNKPLPRGLQTPNRLDQVSIHETPASTARHSRSSSRFPLLPKSDLSARLRPLPSSNPSRPLPSLLLPRPKRKADRTPLTERTHRLKSSLNNRPRSSLPSFSKKACRHIPETTVKDLA